MSGESIQEKAGRARAGVRAIRADQQDENERQRVERRVQETSAELGKLEGHLRTATLLADRAELRFDVSYVKDGRSNLARRSEGGLPNDQSFTAARRKLEAASKRLAEEMQGAWAHWSQEQLDALPLGRKAMLTSQADKNDVEGRIRELRSAQNPKEGLNSTVVTTFTHGLSALRDILDDAPEVPGELLQVLDKIDAGIVTLADVTDEEIALLRQFNQDAYVRLTRKAG